MRKRIFTRLAAGLLCGAMLFTDAASLDVWAVSDNLNAGEIMSLAEPDKESDTIVTSNEGEVQKEKEDETPESVNTEETDEDEAENPNLEEDDATDKEDEEEAALPVEEEQESVSENAVEDESDVNSLMAASEGDIASGTSNDISWVIDKNGKLTVSGSGDFERIDIGYGDLRAPWFRYNGAIKTAVVNATEMTDASNMFSGCYDLTTLDVSNFDTGNVTNMSNMFFYCENLTTLDLSSLNTGSVEDMSHMFSVCKKLTTLDVSKFNTGKVTNMSNMFSSCESLTSLNLSSFDTSSVTDMSRMFEGCSKLTTLDLSSFDTGSVTDMSDMFSMCSNLTTLDLSSFNTSKVTTMFNMFNACSNLTSLDVSKFNTGKVMDMSGMFSGCKNLTTLDVGNFNTVSVTDMSRIFNKCSKLTTLDLSSFDTSSVTYMSYMFEGCSHLTTLDISSFNTGKVTDMRGMFERCNKLTTLDLSNFDTGSLTDMVYMFEDCSNLTMLDLSSFNTSKVTDMFGVFSGCSKLTTLDVSHFDTGNVTNMSIMFGGCSNLTTLDVSHFDTGNVTNMGDMFGGCSNLTTLDVSHFDTSNVTYMYGMFDGCSKLTTLDLSHFDTGNVTNMDGMFYGCSKLTTLDLSSFDTGSVTTMESMFNDCTNLATIYTPRNVKKIVELPAKKGDKWYRSDGTVITELPQNLSDSILITKNKIPEVSEPHITAVKKKTAYVCGDTINTDDITVTYFNDKGASTKLTEGFTTNAAEINATMSTPGMKTLVVTYQPETGKKLETTIELTVTLGLTQSNTVITLPDIQTGSNPVYNSRQHTPHVEVKLAQGDTVLNAGTDYTVSYQNNINAGTAAVVVNGVGVYSGAVEKIFTIDKAKVTIKAKDTTIAVGDSLPETFACEMTGFFNGDEDKVSEMSFSFTAEDDSLVSKDKINTSQTGIYTVTPTTATVGDNYVVDDENGYQPGILTIAEERIVYTVTFDMMGHGTETAPIRSVRSGRLIKEPTAPTAQDYLFTGWYKDIACTKAWDFAVDTVLADTTLYARWVVQTAIGGIQIQEIPEQFYTGNAIKPVPAVYASDGTLLKAGKDYTVKYEKNTNADQVEVTGGTTNSLQNVSNGFDARLPYIEIKGKGSYTGTVYRNFHIRKASIGDGSGNTAAGITLKYTDQLVTNAKSVQNPFSSLKYKKTMTAGKDYTVTYSSDNVRDADGNAVKGANGGKWTVTGTYDKSKNNKYTLPAIPKGYSGVFEMTVQGIGNYEGEIKREIYVTDKENLIKNVTVTLGKNQKNMSYNNGNAVTLTPGYSDGKKYYKVNADGTVTSTPEANANDLFTVKSGKIFLVCGRDYIVTYTDNKAVGTADMTITGIGNYKGSKSAVFKITGKAFQANTIDVKTYNAQTNPNNNDFKASMPYTGSAVTQNKVTLTTKVTKTNPAAKTLRYGEHYTISYKNNIKKGTATMTFTAKPESGYSGSFNKTFKIGSVSLADPAFVKAAAAEESDTLTPGKDAKGNAFYKLNGTVTYTREGSKPSQRIRLTLCDGKGTPTDVVLEEGTDYTVSYTNNTVLKSAATANKIPTMTFKGKGNYTGSLKVTFDINEAAMETGADNLTVTAAAMAYDSKKASAYQYTPKITVLDGKKALSLNKDFTVAYQNCSQQAISAYLDALADKNTTWDKVQSIRPYAVITAVNGSGYTTGTDKGITVYLDISRTKLTGNNLYIIVSDNVYSGKQVMPSQVTVYYSADTKAIAAAKKAKETNEVKLTSASGTYKLTRLTPQTEVNGEGDYTLTYGANVTAGKSKGSVTVMGTGMYGGSVTTKFTILQRDVYTAP